MAGINAFFWASVGLLRIWLWRVFVLFRNKRLIRQHVGLLDRAGFDAEVSNDFSWVCVRNIDLPGWRGDWTDSRGRVVQTTSVLFDIPIDYPMSPPGVGSSHPSRAIHLPLIYFRGELMKDFYRCRHSPWYWFCFQRLDWDPRQDSLLSLVAVVEASICDRVRRI